MAMLLAWGLRLDQLGHAWEAAGRLRRSAAIARRWSTASPSAVPPTRYST